MHSSARALCIIAVCAALCTIAYGASSCDIDHCESCVNNYCIWCEDGYYASGGTCAACTANCRTCGIAGRCTSCNDGYQLSYVISKDSKPTLAKYGSCTAKGTATTCADPKCTSCLDGLCLYCTSGYYVKDGVCASCETAHCTHCEAAGRCLACDAGYVIKYAEATESEVTISRWGTCSNSVIYFSVSATLVAVLSVLLTLLLA